MKPNVIHIEKHIPMPKQTYRRSSKYQFMKRLEVGDSFIIDNNNPDFTPREAVSSIYSYVHMLRKKGGMYRNFRIAIRTLKGSFKQPTSVRVWRIQ